MNSVCIFLTNFNLLKTQIVHITLTSICYLDHFYMYIVKLGFSGVYIISAFYGFPVKFKFCFDSELFHVVRLHQNEPGHEKICLMSYANNKGADQPAHPRSLISALVVRCLDSIISLDSIAEISRL